MIRYSLVLLALAISTALPQAKVVQQTSQQVSIDFVLPETRQIPVEIDGKQYTRIDYAGARFQSEAGSPMLPYSHYRIAIPAGATVTSSYQVIARDQLNNTDLLPTVIVSDLSENNRVPLNRDIYDGGSIYPATIIDVGEPYQYRRMQVVDVMIYPIQYDPAANRVERIRQASITVSWKGGVTTGNPLPFSKQDVSTLSDLIINFDAARNWGVA